MCEDTYSETLKRDGDKTRENDIQKTQKRKGGGGGGGDGGDLSKLYYIHLHQSQVTDRSEWILKTPQDLANPIGKLRDLIGDLQNVSWVFPSKSIHLNCLGGAMNSRGKFFQASV